MKTAAGRQPFFLFAVMFLEVQNRFPITFKAVALDGVDAGHASVGDLPEGFPGVHVGDMNFHRRLLSLVLESTSSFALIMAKALDCT